MPVATVNGTALAYDIVSDGDPIVLVHGSWTFRHSWMFVVEPLADSFRVVTYDRRGHGESAGQPDVGTVHDDVADLAALIEELEIAPAHILANSYGACLALRLGARRPDLVRKIVGHEPPLLGALEASPATKPIAEEEWGKLGRVRERLEAGTNEVAAEYFVDHVALGPGVWAQMPAAMKDVFIEHAPTFLGELRDPDALRVDIDTLAHIEAPVLLTRGDQSPPFFDSVIELLAGIVPDARVQTIAGAGHVPHMTHPAEYVHVVRNFLAE